MPQHALTLVNAALCCHTCETAQRQDPFQPAFFRDAFSLAPGRARLSLPSRAPVHNPLQRSFPLAVAIPAGRASLSAHPGWCQSRHPPPTSLQARSTEVSGQAQPVTPAQAPRRAFGFLAFPVEVDATAAVSSPPFTGTTVLRESRYANSPKTTTNPPSNGHFIASSLPGTA